MVEKLGRFRVEINKSLKTLKKKTHARWQFGQKKGVRNGRHIAMTLLLDKQ
jgi:hypothetical protein